MSVCTWPDLFPTLAAGDPATQALPARFQRIDLPPEQPVFHVGAPCQSYTLVLAGSIRVQVLGEGGREALLYRVLPGQACVLTTCCIMSGEAYPAEGFTESQVTAWALSKTHFERAMDEAPAFRRYVLANLGGRLAQVITRMEELAFRPIERRLAQFLLVRAPRHPVAALVLTHQEIAVELGSAREVISRHLKRLETAGLVRLGRSSIEVLDPQGLERIAFGPL